MRKLLLILALTAIPIGGLWAQTTESEVIARLENSGYKHISTERSWLGRLILEFKTETLQRQIVLNPINGEILRDYSEHLHVGEDGDSWFLHLLNPFGGDDE